MKTTTTETCMNRYKINGNHYFARDEETAILQFKCDYQFRNETRTPKPYPTTPKVELEETGYTLQPYATQLCDEHRELLNAEIMRMSGVMRMPNKRGTCADHIFQLGGYDFLLIADDTLEEAPLRFSEEGFSWYSVNLDTPFPFRKIKQRWGATDPLLYFVDRSKGLVRRIATLEILGGGGTVLIKLLDCLPEDFCASQEQQNRAGADLLSIRTYANYVANFELSSFLENAEVELQEVYSLLEKECA